MYIGSIAIIVFSNILYNIAQKSMPEKLNPFSALLVAYSFAMIITLVMLFFFRPEEGIIQSFKNINWASLGVGTAIVGLEFGFLMAYRAGWNISQGALVANIILAIALIVIGVIFYKEAFTTSKAFGFILCLIGLVFISK